MDFLAQFRRECSAFEAAARLGLGVDDAPVVPSCPEWTLTDLVGHLCGVQRFVSLVVSERHTTPPSPQDVVAQGLPADTAGWPTPRSQPTRGPLPESLVDWFADGASGLAALFATTDPDVPVWTWSPEHTVGFWLRVQTLEAAVHRWDAQNALGAATPIDAELAAASISHHFRFMVPFRRASENAPAGSGERFRFRQTDGSGDWTVRVDGDQVRLEDNEGTGPYLLDLTGTASELLLFMWRRIPLAGGRDVIERYFSLVPPA